VLAELVETEATRPAIDPGEEKAPVTFDVNRDGRSHVAHRFRSGNRME
jgi:hypothetical protein